MAHWAIRPALLAVAVSSAAVTIVTMSAYTIIRASTGFTGYYKQHFSGYAEPLGTRVGGSGGSEDSKLARRVLPTRGLSDQPARATSG